MAHAITDAPRIPGRAAFIRSRVGSALAVLPLSIWTAQHVWDNLSAFSGAAAWQQAVTHHPHPIAEALTVALVLGPLLVHTAWGIGRIATSRPNNVHYASYGNLKFLLMRLSAIGVLLFLGAHIWLAYLRPRLLFGHAEPFADMAREMRFHIPTLVVYLLGTLGVAYHLANGLHTFTMGWGLVKTARAFRRLEVASILLFAVLLAASWAAIYALWRAGGAA